MKILLLLLPFTLLLTACLSNPKTKITSPERLLISAETKAEQHRWVEAEQLLKNGLKKYPDNKYIQEMLASVQIEWKTRKQRLEDWILVYDIEALLAKRPLIVSISNSDPKDFVIKSRLLIVDLSLNSKRDLLLDCTQRQFESHLKLAKRCVVAAEKIKQSIEVQTLLKRIEDEQQGIYNKRTIRENKIAALNRADTRRIMFTQAKENIDNKLYYEAIKLLDLLILQDENDAAAIKLIEETSIFLEQQIKQLVSKGDQLYQDEKIAEALIIWSQASILNPADKEIIQRLERARKVQDKLNKIRINNSDTP